MNTKIYGGILILIGIIYIIRPNIYRVGFWKKQGDEPRIPTSSRYLIYMRIIGIIMIGLGIYLIFWK